jgi:chromatin remodeling complex protein RSC6
MVFRARRFFAHREKCKPHIFFVFNGGEIIPRRKWSQVLTTRLFPAIGAREPVCQPSKKDRQLQKPINPTQTNHMPTETKPKRKANPALLKPVQPDAILAAVVGSTPASRGELTKKLWDYIKKHKLQDEKNKRNINADAALKAVFGGKTQVTMFEMTKLVSAHIK